MAKNDRILLDGIIDDRVALRSPSCQRDEAFELFATEQVLKEYDLTSEDLLTGIVDGRGDGGIDGFFIFVNGHLLTEPESFSWPRLHSELKVILLTCKHHDTFKQSTLDSIIATLTELLDFGIESTKLIGKYSQSLIAKRTTLLYAYRKLSPSLSRFSFDVVYASRGDTMQLGDEVKARGHQVSNLANEHFDSCKATFAFLGCTELVQLHRRTPSYSLELPFVEALAKGERYVILARLSDYYYFVTDNGSLKRHLFDSNVREFMGLNGVNEEIMLTLTSEAPPDFWWLNNGITILATSARIIGKSIHASDIQVVNGLQTTETIFRYFTNTNKTHDDRCIMVKVIVSQDEAIRDSIIRATNNQTNVELASLHATDKIQRDIEDIIVRHGLHYERRKSQHTTHGRSRSEIITPLYLAAGYITLILKAPYRGPSLSSRFMRNSESYNEVFSPDAPIKVWVAIANTLKHVDSELEKLRPRAMNTEKFLKGWRYIVSFIAVSHFFKTFSFSAGDLTTLPEGSITPELVQAIFKLLSPLATAKKYAKSWIPKGKVLAACSLAASEYQILGLERLTARPKTSLSLPYVANKFQPHQTRDLIQSIRERLPKQPWPPGIHREIIRELNCSHAVFSSAIESLIEDGSIYRQKDGVCYDLDGSIVMYDLSRVDPTTLLLRPEQKA